MKKNTSLFSNSFFYLSLILVFVISSPQQTWAWGKRGHQISGEVAALVAAGETVNGWSGAFLKDHSFDFGFYNNVPDIVWKRPETYQKEVHNHFMDMEIFERKLKPYNVTLKDAFTMSRKEFEKKFSDIQSKEGRAFWRIGEIVKDLETVSEKLRTSTTKIEDVVKNKENTEVLVKEHRKLQERWLVLAGVVGHYVSDLAQPLHTSENYDGQLSGQKGIHHIYEITYVDQLYPQLLVDVLKTSKKQWFKFKKENQDKTTLELLLAEVEKSQKDLAPLLEKDKKWGRTDVNKNAQRFKKDIERHLVLGSLTLAEIYRRNLGWQFYGEKFYFFDGQPQFIDPL